MHNNYKSFKSFQYFYMEYIILHHQKSKRPSSILSIFIGFCIVKLSTTSSKFYFCAIQYINMIHFEVSKFLLFWSYFYSFTAVSNVIHHFIEYI